MSERPRTTLKTMILQNTKSATFNLVNTSLNSMNKRNFLIEHTSHIVINLMYTLNGWLIFHYQVPSGRAVIDLYMKSLQSKRTLKDVIASAIKTTLRLPNNQVISDE